MNSHHDKEARFFRILFREETQGSIDGTHAPMHDRSKKDQSWGGEDEDEKTLLVVTIDKRVGLWDINRGLKS